MITRLFSPSKKLFLQRGDTLVEVIVAIVLINFILLGAYSISNRSFQLGISARERTQAAQLLQAQAEALRSLRDNAATFDDFRTQVQGGSDSDGDFYITRNPGSGRWSLNSGRQANPPINGQSSIFGQIWINGAFPQSDKFVGSITIEWPLLGFGPTETSNLAIKLTDYNLPTTQLPPWAIQLPPHVRETLV